MPVFLTNSTIFHAYIISTLQVLHSATAREKPLVRPTLAALTCPGSYSIRDDSGFVLEVHKDSFEGLDKENNRISRGLSQKNTLLLIYSPHFSPEA